MTDVTYSQLVAMISSSGLTDDEEYRINDYTQPTLTSSFTIYASPIAWKIVCTAVSTNEIDDYVTLEDPSDSTHNYTGCYDIDGTKHNYNWVSASNKGVIYYLSDDDNKIDAWFDWKNVVVADAFTDLEGDSFSNLHILNDDGISSGLHFPKVYVNSSNTYYIPAIYDGNCVNVYFNDIEDDIVYATAYTNYAKCRYITANDCVIGKVYGCIEIGTSTGLTIDDSTVVSQDDWMISTGTGFTYYIADSSYLEAGENNTGIRLQDGANNNKIGSNNTVIEISGATDFIIGDGNSYVYINGGESTTIGNNNTNIEIADDTSNNTINDDNEGITIVSGCAYNVISSGRYIELNANTTSCVIKDSIGVTTTANAQDVQALSTNNITIDGTKIAAGSTITPGDLGNSFVTNSVNGKTEILDEDGNITQDPDTPLYDAPEDGNQYARKDGEWTVVSGGTSEASANFRGTWSNWSSVPTANTGYAADYYGHTTPLVNDYMVVTDASDYVVSLSDIFIDVTGYGVAILSFNSVNYRLVYYTQPVTIDGGNITVSWGSDRIIHLYSDVYKFNVDGTVYPKSTDVSTGVRILNTGTQKTIPVVSDTTLSGTWLFRYNGVWSSAGKQGWKQAYQVEGTGATTYTAGQNITITGSSNAINAVGYKWNSTKNSYSEGTNNIIGDVATRSHAEGDASSAISICSHAEGFQTQAGLEYNSGTPFTPSISATGNYSHTEGYQTTSVGEYSHAEGYQTQAGSPYDPTEPATWINYGAHAEGYQTSALSSYSHAEGENTVALSDMYGSNTCHAEGISTTAAGTAAHAEGQSTIASGDSQHVQGKYNVADATSAFIIGNGTSDSARSNAMTVAWDGTLTIGGVSITPTQLQQLLALI